MSESEQENQREELLKTMEDCGSAEMPIDETCLIAEITEAEFQADTEARARYMLGHLKTKLAVRQSVARLAKEGVPTMVKIYLDFNKGGETSDPFIPTDKSDESGEFDGI